MAAVLLNLVRSSTYDSYAVRQYALAPVRTPPVFVSCNLSIPQGSMRATLAVVLSLAVVGARAGSMPAGMAGKGAECPKPHKPHGHRRLQPGHSKCPPAPEHDPVPKAQRTPVMLVPPMLGSQFDIKLDNPPGNPYGICPSTQDFKQAWFPTGAKPGCDSKKDPINCLPPELYPLYADCWGFSLSLQVGHDGLAREPKGIQSRLHTGVQNVCAIGLNCVCDLLKGLGWELGVDVNGFPYDWRRGPVDWSQPGGYYSILKAGIEAMREAAGGKPVLLVSFSLGGPVTSAFLAHYVDEAWKDQHIKGWVSYSGTLGGVVESLGIQLGSGSSFLIPTMSSSMATLVYRSWMSQTWMAATLPPNQLIANVRRARCLLIRE